MRTMTPATAARYKGYILDELSSHGISGKATIVLADDGLEIRIQVRRGEKRRAQKVLNEFPGIRAVVHT